MNEQPPVIVTFPAGQLSKSCKDRLTKHGIIWLETHGDPKDVTQLSLSQPLIQSQITGDAFVHAAMKAIVESADSSCPRKFVKYLLESFNHE